MSSLVSTTNSFRKVNHNLLLIHCKLYNKFLYECIIHQLIVLSQHISISYKYWITCEPITGRPINISKKLTFMLYNMKENSLIYRRINFHVVQITPHYPSNVLQTNKPSYQSKINDAVRAKSVPRGLCSCWCLKIVFKTGVFFFLSFFLFLFLSFLFLHLSIQIRTWSKRTLIHWHFVHEL